jgi:hypothetical protein
MVRRLWIALVFVACSRASDEGQAKKWQAPPPAEVEIPAALSIGVTIDGSAKPSITSEMLKSTKPDFVDDDHRAWRLPILLGPNPPGSTVEAVSPIGVSVKFTLPLPDNYEPVLFLSRRGEVIVAAVDPKDPFPKFHGQGSRLRRPGDSMPRVAPVTRLVITRPTP